MFEPAVEATQESGLAESDVVAQATALLSNLSDIERRVVSMRFGIGGDGEKRTLLEIGNEVGLSRERVRQIEAAALAAMRKRRVSNGKKVEARKRIERRRLARVNRSRAPSRRGMMRRARSLGPSGSRSFSVAFRAGRGRRAYTSDLESLARDSWLAIREAYDDRRDWADLSDAERATISEQAKSNIRYRPPVASDETIAEPVRAPTRRLRSAGMQPERVVANREWLHSVRESLMGKVTAREMGGLVGQNAAWVHNRVNGTAVLHDQDRAELQAALSRAGLVREIRGTARIAS